MSKGRRRRKRMHLEGGREKVSNQRIRSKRDIQQIRAQHPDRKLVEREKCQKAKSKCL